MKTFNELFEEQFGGFLFSDKPRGAVKTNQTACTGAFNVDSYQNEERRRDYQDRKEAEILRNVK